MIRNGLRIRLTLIFIALAVLPILLVGIVFSWLSFISLPIQALDLQKEIAQGMGARVHKLIEDRQQELYFLTNIRSIWRLDREQQVSLLSELLADQNAYDELTLIDAQGQEQIRLAREIFVTPDELTNRLGKVEFQYPKRSGKVYFGPIQVNPETGESFMSIAIPLIRPRDETFFGVLVATIRFKPVWDILVSEQDDDSNRTVYIVDKTNRVVAHADKPLVLGETFVDLEVKEGATLGLDGVNDVIRATYPIHLGEQRLFVVAERPVSEALALTISTLYITGGATLIALIFAIGPSILIVYRIMRPINQLALTAQAISIGDLSQQVTVNSQDEVGILADAFNKMAEQLKNFIGGLEQRVSERTQGLEISATLSENLTAILDLDQLLSELVTQVKDNFGYYHVQVYLLDEQKLQLNMVSGSGEAGKQMKIREHSIPLNAPTSLVARAARQANVVMVNNVREEPGWLFNPLLSETTSEVAVPIILNKDVVGVLDVQENKIAGLDDGDASILRPLANQVAVAIRNARLFSDVQKALTEARRIQSQYVQRAWLENQTVQHRAYYQRPESLTLDENTHIFLDRLARTQHQPQALSLGDTQSMSMDNEDDIDIEKDKDLKIDLESNDLPYTALIAPIKLQNQIIGSMQFYETDLSRRHIWTDQEIAFMQTIADQIAQTAENLRLFEEMRHRADYERLVSEITQKIRQAPNLEALTKTAAETLSQVLGVSDSVIRLHTKINEDPPNAATSQADVLKVVILLPGPIDDQGWRQAGYEGLKLIEQELEAQVAYVENVPIAQTEQEKIIRQYVQEEFELLIGHGGEYIPALETMSEVFPEMQFAVVTNYEGNNRNLGALSIRSDESGYLAGVVAALKTKTNQVAYIGGEMYLAGQREALGFEKGVKDTNLGVDISIAWVNSWSDQQKARDIALILVESGVDVLAVDADLAGLAALEVAEAEGIQAIGWVVDQHALAPNAIVASVIQDMPQRILQSAILVQQGRWEGKQYQFGLREGIVSLSPLYGDWTADEEAILNQVQEKILRGQIETLPR